VSVEGVDVGQQGAHHGGNPGTHVLRRQTGKVPGETGQHGESLIKDPGGGGPSSSPPARHIHIETFCRHGICCCCQSVCACCSFPLE